MFQILGTTLCDSVNFENSLNTNKYVFLNDGDNIIELLKLISQKGKEGEIYLQRRKLLYNLFQSKKSIIGNTSEISCECNVTYIAEKLLQNSCEDSYTCKCAQRIHRSKSVPININILNENYDLKQAIESCCKSTICKTCGEVLTISRTLLLNNEIYFIRGVICFLSGVIGIGHYFSIEIRDTGINELYNDCERKVRLVNDCEKTLPHLLIYSK